MTGGRMRMRDTWICSCLGFAGFGRHRLCPHWKASCRQLHDCREVGFLCIIHAPARTSRPAPAFAKPSRRRDVRETAAPGFKAYLPRPNTLGADGCVCGLAAKYVRALGARCCAVPPANGGASSTPRLHPPNAVRQRRAASRLARAHTSVPGLEFRIIGYESTGWGRPLPQIMWAEQMIPPH